MSLPTSFCNSRNATCTMPAGSKAPDPTSSFTDGIPNKMTAGTPSSASCTTSPRKESSVCCTTPGSDVIGWADEMPSRTNSGATRSLTPKRTSATSSRMAGLCRRRRGRDCGNAIPVRLRALLFENPNECSHYSTGRCLCRNARHLNVEIARDPRS